MNNKIELVKYLLKQPIDINALSNVNQTALMIACNYHNNEIAKLLLDHQADIHCIDHFGFR